MQARNSRSSGTEFCCDSYLRPGDEGVIMTSMLDENTLESLGERIVAVLMQATRWDSGLASNSIGRPAFA
jgi:hypothetical protein